MSLDELKAAAVAMLDRAYCPYSPLPGGGGAGMLRRDGIHRLQH